MQISNFTLIKKISLNSDIFELIFKLDTDSILIPKAWQFVTFLLPLTKFGRAYSIVKSDWINYTFIIKRLANWRWWSKEICDINIWEVIKWIWPTGHFILNSKKIPQLFIWTWVGFAPLYNMINESLENWNKGKIKLVFWIRFNKDIFYKSELDKIKEKYPNFDYTIYTSREKIEWYKKWYVTDYIGNNITNYKEFYICWNPNVIESSKNKLLELWVNNKNIYYEKY